MAAQSDAASDHDLGELPKSPGLDLLAAGAAMFSDKLRYSGTAEDDHQFPNVSEDPGSQLLAGNKFSMQKLTVGNLRSFCKLLACFQLNRSLRISTVNGVAENQKEQLQKTFHVLMHANLNCGERVGLFYACLVEKATLHFHQRKEVPTMGTEADGPLLEMYRKVRANTVGPVTGMHTLAASKASCT